MRECPYGGRELRHTDVQTEFVALGKDADAWVRRNNVQELRVLRSSDSQRQGDVAIDNFTLVELNSFTLDTSHDHDGTSWMEVAYNHYCSNYAQAEILYDYDDPWECMEHCQEDADCNEGYFWYGDHVYDYYDGGYGDNSCILFGTADSDADWCAWAWGDWSDYGFYRASSDDTLLTFDGVTLFDQHLVDTLTFVQTACHDTDDGAADPYWDTCVDYDDYPGWCGNGTYDDDDFSHDAMCCACGGGDGDDVISLDHTDGALIPAFHVSASEISGEISVENLKFSIENYTWVELDSFMWHTD